MRCGAACPALQGKLPAGPGRGWELLGGVIYRVLPAKNVACIAAVPFSEKTDLLSELQRATSSFFVSLPSITSGF